MDARAKDRLVGEYIRRHCEDNKVPRVALDAKTEDQRDPSQLREEPQAAERKE